MDVRATVKLKNKDYPATVKTTRVELATWFKRRADDVEWLIADICLTRWYYTEGDWFKAGRFRYVPNRPDLWHVSKLEPKPTNNTPFDRV